MGKCDKSEKPVDKGSRVIMHKRTEEEQIIYFYNGKEMPSYDKVDMIGNLQYGCRKLCSKNFSNNVI